MGLDMKTRKKITGVTAKRYRNSDKNGKTKILDEFVHTTGYNRKYALHLLANWGTSCVVEVDGKPVKLRAGKPARKRKPGGGRPRVYTDDVIAALRTIWEFFDFQCGTLLAPLIRLMIDFLAADPLFGVTAGIRAKLLKISPSTIDRGLKSARKALALKGRSLTKPGGLLRHQIPVRTFFHWDERKPGFFELDTVSHCGPNSSGVFCSTLTLTDVYSGWTRTLVREERALRNRAHRWVTENTAEVKATLPFPLLGIDSDNGGEFINTQLVEWARENGVQFTRGRPYRKNDNCFVEQKNGDIVRKTVGYHRYDTDEEHLALAEIYRLFCPLLNFWYPSLKITGKEKLPSGRYKKLYDQPKTPYQRLLESPDLSDTVKDELRRRASLINPVDLKRLVILACARLDEARSRKEKQLSGDDPSPAHG
ncbi:integrase [Spirochaetia bacterium]|nr:integrase [Spirochaetia bacterium]